MASRYRYRDRAWNITHSKTGKHLGVATVSADSVRQAVEHAQRYGERLSPESVEDDLLQNSAGNILFNNKVGPDDVEFSEIKSQPRRGPRKSYDGAG